MTEHLCSFASPLAATLRSRASAPPLPVKAARKLIRPHNGGSTSLHRPCSYPPWLLAHMRSVAHVTCRGHLSSCRSRHIYLGLAARMHPLARATWLPRIIPTSTVLQKYHPAVPPGPYFCSEDAPSSVPPGLALMTTAQLLHPWPPAMSSWT